MPTLELGKYEPGVKAVEGKAGGISMVGVGSADNSLLVDTLHPAHLAAWEHSVHATCSG